MKTFGISGASGFIGKWILKVPSQTLWKPVDLRTGDRNQRGVLSGFVHLAGSRTRLDEDSLLLDRVLRLCEEHSCPLIFASSAAVYSPAPSQVPVSEDHLLGPVLAYGRSKLESERKLRDFVLKRGIPVRVLRIFNVYGPGQQQGFLIPDLVQMALGRLPVGIRQPRFVRDWIHVQDVARAFHAAAETPISGLEVMNISTGIGMEVGRLWEILCRFVGRIPEISAFEGSSGNEVPWMVGDFSVARARLGWSPQVDLASGLRGLLDKDQ